ncbi:MAG: VWA domain-containing protein [Clostridia bacterium]|jgi:Ca-activated chloride channel family protein|nr:VWA domain-containing protein [Clostridia bacterium]
MRKENNNGKVFSVLIAIGLVVFGIIYMGISLTKNLGKSKDVISKEKTLEVLNDLYDDITVNKVEARKAHVELETTDLKDALPDISKYPAQVENTTNIFIEIFSSPEKAGEDKDSWLIKVAEDFNKAGVTVNGKAASVRIRSMASGMAMDYIVSGKYQPDAYTPSNELWGEMMKAQGSKVTLVEKRLVGNVSGVLMSKKKYDELMEKYGSINLKNITEAVAENKIAMGYTNPFASSTGLNFLISTLSTFDIKDPLSDKAVEGFEKFQTNIPFVAYTTMQMRESAKSGVLDGFIMEYQTYINAADLKSQYVFTPFGYRHDSPLYGIGDLSDDKKEILNKFVEFCKNEKYQKLAKEYGFNELDNYKSEVAEVSGDVISQAQRLWKEKKNLNQEIVAVFVADVSGSMAGEPLNKLKQSLISSSQYIGKENSIGLVTFSSEVNVNLPIGKFDLNHRSLFTGAVTDMQAEGGTAMYDGIIVGTKMLMEEKEKNPDAKFMLFVLSDGETNVGHSLNHVEDIIKNLKIPVYTIGYNANIKALSSISAINEAASINADSDDVVYKLGSLFNAEM